MSRQNPIFRPLPYFHQWIFAIVGFGILFGMYKYTVLRQWDFNVYYLASIVLAEGENPYDPQSLMNQGDETIGVGYGGLPYLYSPLLACLMYPLGCLPFFEASLIWALLKCIALEFSIFLILHLLKKPPSIFWLILLHIIVLSFRPIALDINAGNVAIFESTLILLFLASWQNHKNWIASISLCIAATLFKGIPLLLILYPLHLRDWQFLRRCIAVGCGIALYFLIDYSATLQWMQFFQSPTWQRLWDEQVQSFYNCSSTTVILRTFSDTYFAEPLIRSDLAVSVLVPLFPLLVFLLTCWIIHKYRKRSENPHSSAILALLMCTLLLLTPRLAGYTLAWTVFPLTFSLIHSIQYRNWLCIFLLAICLFCFQTAFSPEHIPHGIMQLLIDKEFFGLLSLYASLLFYMKCANINPNK